MSDTLDTEHRYLVLNVIDEGTHEALDIRITTSLPIGRIVPMLDALLAKHGKPRRIQVDNTAEMTSTGFVEWCEPHKIQTVHIQPGKPNQNAYIEGFKRSFGNKVLYAKMIPKRRMRNRLGSADFSCTEKRSHAALDNVPPSEFKR
ncbi:integrase core domain-containing protein [Luminiphilus sp.]|jgi:putative transposase|nr:integrase core domain-containing protein [Luminiphilus sp.]